MKAALAILAVTKMRTGVCLAGVRPDAPAVWVRPVREHETVLLGDITYPPAPSAVAPPHTRRVMQPFDLAELALLRPRPDPPHIEDWICDFARDRPRLRAVLPAAERAALLDAAATSIEAVWVRSTRSLGTLAVPDLTATFTRDGYTGKYEARLAFPGLPAGGPASIACTDLKWRALGRRLLAEQAASVASAASGNGLQTLTHAGDTLRAVLGGADRIWLALGSSRTHDGRHWPLIVGVHTLPDYEATIDYHQL
jgi:hypothetical protein